MTSHLPMALQHPDAALLEKPDGFSIHLDLAHERADIVLGRPPFNVILMPQRDQLRAAFEALDAHPGVRVIVLRAESAVLQVLEEAGLDEACRMHRMKTADQSGAQELSLSSLEARLHSLRPA